MFIKQEYIHAMSDRPTEDDLGEGPSTDPYIRISGVTNENWRGKNDPTERRRIQNRLNQRAFRQRQRAGESSKPYRPRSRSGGTSSGGDDEAPSSPPGDEQQQVTAGHRNTTSAPFSSQRQGSTDASGRVWDELANLINRNLMAAAATNARRLGITADSLRAGERSLTPAITSHALPLNLQPVQLQHSLPHDPVIAIIPHPRMRYNILMAIAAQQLDAAAFSKHLRASGALQYVDGQWRRSGLIVWSSPEEIASWELSELLVHFYGALILPGCEDLLAATNAWRSRRGERLFPTSIHP